MLARSFMSAAELRISEKPYAALITFLGMLERDEVRHENVPEGGIQLFIQHLNNGMPVGFNMKWVAVGKECGTVCCIKGWAECIAGSRIDQYKEGLSQLFFMNGYEAPNNRPEDILPAHAALAINNYLTTGEPSWSEVLAPS